MDRTEGWVDVELRLRIETSCHTGLRGESRARARAPGLASRLLILRRNAATTRIFSSSSNRKLNSRQFDLRSTIIIERQAVLAGKTDNPLSSRARVGSSIR
jgi:hypothetical protein